jgi:putative flavoprotein involved in K+ transport
MPTIETVVIGAGQAGLAASRCLAERSIDHVVLERGRLAERWRSERWDSLRLLTPNWMTRVPGWTYAGSDPQEFMTAAEVVTFLQGYGRASRAPVEEWSAVERLDADADGGGFQLATASRSWRARNVVMATGWCDLPVVPAIARELDPRIHQVVPSAYRNTASLPDGGVLVVGASATGVQLAEELRGSGREVVLAVGSHTRLPRRYRGMDIFWWLDRIGAFDKTIDQMPDPVGARLEPSLQLAGRPDHRTLDLAALAAGGVELVGRVIGIDRSTVGFADDLHRSVASADARMIRLLQEIDAHIDATGMAAEVLDRDSHRPVPVGPPVGTINLRARRIRTVVWATGYRRSYPWLRLPVLDGFGEIGQSRGVTAVPGLYVLGQRFQHFRNSNFIDGVGRDAAFVADHLSRRASTVARA